MPIKSLPVTIAIAAEASRHDMTRDPMTGHVIEPLTSRASKNLLPVGSTNYIREG